MENQRHYGLPQNIIDRISNLYQNFEYSSPMLHLIPILFNITLDYIMRQITENALHAIQKTIFSQLEDIDYADDITILLTIVNHLQKEAHLLT